MKTGKTAVALLAAALALAPFGATGAMEWPLLDATVLRNFGFNDRGRPGLGVVLAGRGDALAAAAGEVLFRFDPGAGGAARFPSPLGAWIAVDHGNGLVSVYARLGGLAAEGGASVAAGDAIGVAGVSGASGAEGGLFTLYDRRERRWVNPAMIAAPFPDALAPRIYRVRLRGEDGSTVDVVPGQSVAQGRHAVLVEVSDDLSGGRGTGLAPHRVVVSVNGAEEGRLALETIVARDGVALANRETPIPVGRVHGAFPAFEAAEAWLNRGQAIIEVVAWDVAGNSAVFVANVAVE